MRIETTCVNCGKEIVKYTRQKEIHNWYCSLECKSEHIHKLKQELYKCDNCNNEFILYKTDKLKKGFKHYFCCKQCFSDFLKNRQTLICDQCGKIFERPDKSAKKSKNHFCSQDCYFKFIKRVETDEFKKYYYIVGKETYKWEKQLLMESEMICYYTGQKLITTEEFKQLYPEDNISKNKLVPSIDHKIPISYGFKHNIDPKIIGGKDNLCVCAMYVNSIKSERIYTDENFINKVNEIINNANTKSNN